MTDTATKPKIGDSFDPAKHDPSSRSSAPGTAVPGADAGAATPPAGASGPAGAAPAPSASGGSAPAAAKAGRAPAARPDASPKRGPGRPAKAEQRVERIGSSLASIGMAVMIINPADGMAVVMHSPGIADALGKLAEENPRVAKFLDGATQANAWMGVAVAVTPLVLAILANHGMVPGADALGAAQGANTMDALFKQQADFNAANPLPNMNGAGAAG